MSYIHEMLSRQCYAITENMANTCLKCPLLRMKAVSRRDPISNHTRSEMTATCKKKPSMRCPDNGNPSEAFAKDMGMMRFKPDDLFGHSHVINLRDMTDMAVPPDGFQFPEDELHKCLRDVQEDRSIFTDSWDKVVGQFDSSSVMPLAWEGKKHEYWKDAATEHIERHIMPAKNDFMSTMAASVGDVAPFSMEATEYMVDHLKFEGDFLMTLGKPPSGRMVETVEKTQHKQKTLQRETYHNWGAYS